MVDVVSDDAGDIDAPPIDAPPTEAATAPPAIDLDRLADELAGVEAALARLDDGSYWTDEITGEPLDEQLLADDPVARRNR
jgi:hypothetical protein